MHYYYKNLLGNKHKIMQPRSGALWYDLCDLDCGGFEYFCNCWSPGIFTHSSLKNKKNIQQAAALQTWWWKRSGNSKPCLNSPGCCWCFFLSHFGPLHCTYEHDSGFGEFQGLPGPSTWIYWTRHILDVVEQDISIMTVQLPSLQKCLMQLYQQGPACQRDVSTKLRNPYH